jgi:hypothetical protein
MAKEAKRPERLAGERAQKLAAQYAEDKESTEEQHGVDAGPALMRPVHVLQIQPEREFVQRQGCAYAVQQRHHSFRQAGLGMQVGAKLEQPTIAHDQQEHDTQNQVMNVATAYFDVVKRADPGSNGVRKQSHDRERDIERHGSEEPALAVSSGKVVAVEGEDPVPVVYGGGQGEHYQHSYQEDSEGDTCGMQSEMAHGDSRIARRERRWELDAGCRGIFWPGPRQRGEPRNRDC